MSADGREITLLIDSLGAQGDGVGTLEGKPVYVAGALAGETVSVVGEGAKPYLGKIINPSGERAEPFCRYFNSCGGCQVQHLSDDAYVKWKTEISDRCFFPGQYRYPARGDAAV